MAIGFKSVQGERPVERKIEGPEKISQKISGTPKMPWEDEEPKMEKLDVPKIKRQIAATSAEPEIRNGKCLVSIRYDEKVLVFFKGRGKGWQSRMNEVLRSYVEAHSGREQWIKEVDEDPRSG